MMPTKTQLITIGYVLLTLAAINKVQALEPVKKLINDKGLF